MRLVHQPFRGRPRPALPLALALAAAALLPRPAAAQSPTNTWTNVAATGTASWLAASNWGGATPVSSPTTILQFNAVGTASFTAQNDIANPFSLNGFLLNSNATGTGIVITSAASRSLQLTGTNPFVNQIGPGAVTFNSSAGLSLNPTSGTTTIGGAGSGALNFSGVIAGSGGLTINQTGTALVSFTAANTFTGDVNLQNGNLSISGTALGTNTLTVNGGTFRSTGTVTPNILLNTDLLYTGTGSTVIGTSASANTISGGGGFRLLGVATVDFQQSHTYTGPTVVSPTAVFGTGPGALGNLASNAVLQVSNTNGSIANSSAVTVNLGTLNLGTAGGGTNSDRIGDTTPVTLNRGTLRLNATGGSVTETTGGLFGSGYSVVDVQAAGSVNTWLQPASLNRVANGTFAFTGAGLGSIPGAGVANVFFGTAPALVGGGGSAGTATLSILPYAVGGLGNAAVPNSLVTYDFSGGVRPLDLATEYAAYTGANSAADNVRITAAATGLAGQTVNALVIDNSTASGFTVAGTGTLTLGSGALLVSGSQPVTLGGFAGLGAGAGSGGELVVHVTNTSGGVTLASPVAASVTGGLTKSGPGALFLTAANGYSGGTTINGGSLFVTADNQLGTGGVTLSGGTLQYTGPTAALSAGRSVTLAGAGGGIGVASGTTLTVPGAVGGAGDLYKTGQGTLVLTNTNNATTATGRTVITSGVVAIDSAAELPGGVVAFEPAAAAGGGGGVTLRFLANQPNFNKTITVNGISTASIVSGWLDTNGFNVTLTGTLTNSIGASRASVVKVGAGTLAVTSAQPFAGEVAVAGGTLTVTSDGSLRSGIPSAVFGGTLTLDNAATPVANRVADATLTLGGGNLNFIGFAGAGGGVTESVGNLTLNSFTANTITLTPGSGGATTLAAAALTNSTTSNSTNGVLLVRGSGLGATPGVGSTNLLFTSTTPTLVGGSGAFGTPAVNILPRFYGDASPTGAGTDLVTYDTVRGVRPLTAAEYTNAITSGSSVLNNVKLTTAAGGLDDPTVVNSLVLGGGGGVSGAGALTVNSGTVLAAAGNAGVNVGVLSFGSAVGSVRTTGDLTIGSTVVGGGLTKSGAGTLTLNGVVNVGGVTTAGNFDVLAVAEGGLVFGPAAVVSPNTRVALMPGTSLDLGGVNRTLGSVANLVLGPSIALPLPQGAGSTVSLGAGTLTVTDATTPAFAGTITGTGGLTVQSFANGSTPMQAALFGANTYSGPTTVAQGSLSLIGAAGSIANSTAINITGGTLVLDEAGSTVGFLTNLPIFNPNPRIKPDAPISLAGALAVIGHPTLPKNVTAGPLTLTGGAAVIVTPGPIPIGSTTIASAAGTTVTFASLTRANNAAVLFAGDNLGDAPAPGVANVFFTTPPAGLVGGGGPAGTTTVSILPYAVGATTALGQGNTLVTYTPAVGVRPLDLTSEYATYATAGATDNVRTTASLTGLVGKAVNALVIDNSTALGTTTVSGTGTLTVQGGAVLFAGATSANTTASSNAATISGFSGLNFGGGEAVFSVTNTHLNQSAAPATTAFGTLNVNVPITAGGITKGVGGGTLVLNADNSAVTGGLTVNQGTVSFVADNNLGAAGAGITMGGSYAATAGTSFGGLVGSPRLLYTGAAALTLSRPINLTAGSAIFDSTSPVNALRLGGAITGPGGVMTGVGNSTSTINLTPTTAGTHTYTGPTRVSGGTLEFTADGDLGSGGAVQLDGGTVALLGNWTSSRNVYVTGNTTLSTGNFTATLSGPVAGTAPSVGTSATTLTKMGAGILNLSGANSFNAALNVSQGTVVISSNTALGNPTGGTTVGSGAVLQMLNDITVAAEPLTLNSSGTGGTSALQSLSGTNAWTGPVTLNAAATVLVYGGRLSVGGPVGGSSGLTKIGGGTLNLLGANTYTGGTTVNQGTLLVNNTVAGSSGTGSGAVTVNGGTLGGNGTITGAVTVNSGGTLAPGNSPGLLTVGSATLNSGSTFSVELNGPTTPGTDYDQLLATGSGTAVNLGGATLTGTFGFSPQSNQLLTIISTPNGTISGQFAGGTVFAFGGYTGTVQYNPNSVVLTGFTPVPEPALVLVACGAVGGLVGWVRRRRASAPAAAS